MELQDRPCDPISYRRADKAVEKSCTENDIKKAYKKLALALHPDKNGAPGADEAFKSTPFLLPWFPSFSAVGLEYLK